jgi:hypothetical protein
MRVTEAAKLNFARSGLVPSIATCFLMVWVASNNLFAD